MNITEVYEQKIYAYNNYVNTFQLLALHKK